MPDPLLDRVRAAHAEIVREERWLLEEIGELERRGGGPTEHRRLTFEAARLRSCLDRLEKHVPELLVPA